MAKELVGADIPGSLERELTADVAWNFQRRKARRAKILVEHADRFVADHVERSRHRKRSDGHAASERLKLNETKCVGLAREHEHIGRGDVRGEACIRQCAK